MNKPVSPSLLDDVEQMMTTRAPAAPVAEISAMAVSTATDDHDSERWTAKDEYLVIADQPATRVYQNVFRGVVIAQEARDYGDDDPFIHVQPKNLPALVAALQRSLPKRA
jgi:hypothetical protein